MIPRVHKRHNDLGNLVRYLYSPGRCEEHKDPHLVAAWDGAGELAALEPPAGGRGRDVRVLVRQLAQPLRAARYRPRSTVWHCSIRTAPEDRLLSDAEWGQVACEVMDAVGLAPLGDGDAVRWIAVRHADDHIHLAATLVRQDGRTAKGWRDMVRARQRCSELEQRWGLRRVGPMDRTSHRRPGAAELNKARRRGRSIPARDELRRLVRATAVSSVGEDEFFARLADAGVLLRFRFSELRPGERTGYAVALVSDLTAAGEPVWFSGGKLAADLTLPKLRMRWTGLDKEGHGSGGPVRVSPAARVDALTRAAEAIRGAADAMRQVAGGDPDVAQAVAQAAADNLTAAARAVEGRRGGPLTEAAELFDKAARGRDGRVAKPTASSMRLRGVSRLVAVMGRVAGDGDTYAVMALLMDLARLADALAAFRQAQQRWHQAEAANRAAVILRAAAGTTLRLSPTTHIDAPDLTTTATTGPPAEPAPGHEAQTIRTATTHKRERHTR